MTAIASKVLYGNQRCLWGFKAITPFDDDSALIKELIQPEVCQLAAVLQAVEVDVRHLQAPGVHANQLKGWARDVSRRAHASHDSADEGRLAGAKVAFEKNEIALRKPLCKLLTRRLRFRGSGGDDVKQSGRSRSRAAAAARRRRRRL